MSSKFNGLSLFGVDEIGLDAGDFGNIFQATGEIMKSGIALNEKRQAEQKSAADEQSSMQAAIVADAAAANAIAKAAVSKQLKSASAAMDQTAAEMAKRAQERAAAKLSDTGAEKRTDAAEKALNLAIAASQAAPKDGYKAALVKAWTEINNMANHAQLTSAPSASRSDAGEEGHGGSWFTRKVIGPVPGWGVAAIGTAGVVAVLTKALIR